MRPTDHRPPADPTVYAVKRLVYVVRGPNGHSAEFKTENEARRDAAYNHVLSVKHELAEAMVTDGAPPSLNDSTSIAAWLIEHRDTVRTLFDRVDAAEADVMLIPLLDGAEPPTP